MKMNATVFAAAAALCVTAPAWAEESGILVCQIGVSQFAEDIYGSKANLRPGQLAAAADLVELSRSQCRSSPGIVNANITAARQQLSLATGRRAGTRFDDFWPASDEELSMLTK
jgi:hypothetical protein